MQAITDILSASPGWLRLWAAIETEDADFIVQLKRKGLDRPLTWAGWAKGSGDLDLRVSQVLAGLGLTSLEKSPRDERRRARGRALLQGATGLG